MSEDAKYGNPASKVGRLIEQIRRIPEGSELLDCIDDFCGYHQTVFHPQSERQNNFNQGKQSVANWLHAKHEKYMNERKTNE